MPSNALSHEKSPYLRQHANNPVDWFPWGETAFQKARAEDKPIFLSIGYSTCHWCHVMAHESFENEQVAALLNRDFVPVKVDREERPDVDRIYMLFVQASTGSGGWPMSVFLTPELKPFFGGTYFPPDSRYGRPGFADLLRHLAHAWHNERQRIDDSSDNVLDQLRAMSGAAKITLEADQSLFESGFAQFSRSFDRQYGGFNGAPKFPRPVVLNYLFRYHAITKDASALEMVTETLDAMAAGGMHDHLGGGFHRYSVDARWFVPHFEKMLYDQAQLAVSYLEAVQITREPRFAEVAHGIFRYVLRDLTSAEGAFYSAEDADSPDPENRSHSGEGAFYIWREREIQAILGQQDAAAFCSHFGVEQDGNVHEDPHGEFTGRNILYQARPEAVRDLETSKQKLLQERNERPRPHLDNKVLTSWNALMISAFVKGAVVLEDDRYLQTAQRAAGFLLDTMYDRASGWLKRRFCDGEAAIEGFLDDYAFFAQALLDLFEATGEARYFTTAIAIAGGPLREFEDVSHGGFFSTRANAPDLVLRIKDDYDGAEPSGNSVATDVLLRLAHLTGHEEFRARAEKALVSFAPKLKAQPTIAPQMSVALGRTLVEAAQTVIRCERTDGESLRVLSERSAKSGAYAAVLRLSDRDAATLKDHAPFLAGLERKGRMTIYECRSFTCQLPEIIE